MNQFFAFKLDGEIAHLSGVESQHLKVLRKQSGDEIRIVDGHGNAYTGKITRLHKNGSHVLLQDVVHQIESPPLLDIAIAPTKSNDRFEWFLEKATEIGVCNIYPFISYHSERKVIKLERMQKIVLSAMKQSLRLWLPQIHGIQRLDSIIHSKSFEGHQKFIPSTDAREIHFKTAIEQAKETLVLIGPEGGFSEKEINDAISAGFLNVTLGPNRLRTETAGIVVCSIFANS